MKGIGGYFGLELKSGNEFHQDLLGLNTGRNALLYLLKTKKYRKIYIPYYSCDALFEPVKKLGIEYALYHLNSRLEPIFDYGSIDQDTGFLYINYFGIKQTFVNNLTGICKNLIVDNAQAFFSRTSPGVDVFYSPRKFFGVPDGAYLRTNNFLDEELPKDMSCKRFAHLLMRTDLGPQDGFRYFQENEKLLGREKLMKMSNITREILKSIDYPFCIQQRNTNFIFLHRQLKNENMFQWINEEGLEGPLAYPLYTDRKGLREKLIQNGIFIPLYWQSVLQMRVKSSPDYDFAENILPLPVDQRYDEKDMSKIIDIIYG